MKKIYAFLAVLSLTTGMMASPVSKKAAAGIAKDFFAQQATNSTNTTNGKTTKTSVEVAYESNELYVFNGNSGFVVVSADDQTEPVLAWSDNEQFDAQTVNPATKMWLESYKQQIQALKDNGGLQVLKLTNYDEIAPLVPFKWNQSAPYNKFVPLDQKTGKPSLTGCPSISLGQVIATVRYPDGVMPRGIPQQTRYSYEDSHRTVGQEMEALAPIAFDWNKMAEKYDKDDMSDAPDEVAQLISYVGYAVGMAYSESFSGASSISVYEAARLYFGFSEVKELFRATCTSEFFENTIYNELKEGRPVIFQAAAIDEVSRQSGGHSFIIDGYKNGYYHVNWGWGGAQDGHFVLSVLNSNYPEEKGLKVANGYNIEADIVYGFKKPTVEDPADGVNKLAVRIIDLTSSTESEAISLLINRNSESENFPAFIEGVLFDRDFPPYIDKVYDVAWNLYNPATGSYVFAEPKARLLETSFLSGTKDRKTFSITIPKEVADGTYHLHWLFRDCKGEKNTDKWYPCHLTDEYYAIVTVAGNSLTVMPSIDDFDRMNDLVINTAAVDEGVAKVYKPVTLKFNITNLTNSNAPALHLWLSKNGEDYALYSGTAIQADKGESADVYFQFTPNLAGRWYVGLGTMHNKFNAKDNLLPYGRDYITVYGTSLEFNVAGINKEAEEEEQSESTPLLKNVIGGQYRMSTTDERPCEKLLYIVLKKYNEELKKFEYSTSPDAPTNKAVTGVFEDDKPILGEFSFDIEGRKVYRLAVGELVGNQIELVYNYQETFIYNGDTPSAVGNVKAAEGSAKSNIYFDLGGRRIEGKPASKGLYIHDGAVEAVQ